MPNKPLITINNSYSQISGLSVKADKELRDLLSYVVGGQSAYFSGYGVRRKSLLSKRGELATGLVPRVKDFLGENNYTLKDNRLYSGHSKSHRRLLKTVKFYDWQVRAASKALVMGRGTIAACTGSGKSLTMALVASLFNVSTLIVVPTLELRKQLTETFLELFGPIPGITIKNIDDPSLYTDTKYDLLMIDEVHHSAAATYQKLNRKAWNGIYYRINFTATPFRNDKEETLLYESLAGQVIYELDYKVAAAKGYVVPVEGYYLDVPKQDTDAYTYQEVYNQLVVKNDIRNELIALFMLKLNAADKSILCLVKEVAHGKILAKLTGLPFVSGEDNESRDYIRQFNSGGIKAVIATEGMMSEGVDTKPCEFVILAGLGKAKSATMQKIGRCIRTYPDKESGKVVLIRDKSHKYLMRHFNEQKKILLEEYGVKCLQLDI